MSFDEYEEPQYRSIEEFTTSTPKEFTATAVQGSSKTSLCSSIKPTAQFVSQIPEEQLIQNLNEWFMANGADYVNVEESQVEVGFKTARMPLEVMFRVATIGDTTNISIRR